MDNERYMSVEQSIIEACKEVREMRAGRLPEREWREVFSELKAEIPTDSQISMMIKNIIEG